MSDETIPRPYLLFLGEAPSNLWAKTAAGIAHWRPDWCAGQISLPGCGADCDLDELSLEAAVARGAKTLVIGVAPAGGAFPDAWTATVVAAIEAGLQDKLYLGNLDARRDWGHARDYMEGAWLILQQDEPDDYVLATGELRSVRQLVEGAVAIFGRHI